MISEMLSIQSQCQNILQQDRRSIFNDNIDMATLSHNQNQYWLTGSRIIAKLHKIRQDT